MQKLAAVLLTLLATSAFAFQGRPVSDLRFDGRASVYDHQVATDGIDFLVLSSPYVSGQRHTFTQKVAGGRPAGPQRQIGSGVPAGLAWTGNAYLAAWRDGQNLWVSTVSRDGSPTSTPTAPVMAGGAFMVANGDGALAFGLAAGAITVQRLDLMGRPVGSAVTYDRPPETSAIASGPAAGGFGVVFTGSTGTWLMTFRVDGSAITSAPVLLDGPFGSMSTDRHTNEATVATDGRDTIVIFGSMQYREDAQLKSAVVGPDGTVKSVRVIYTLGGTPDRKYISPAALVWDDSQYIAGISVAKDPDHRVIDPALVRIAPNGERIGDLQWISGDEAGQTALASNGTDVARMALRLPAGIGRTLTTQDVLTIEAGPGGYLAAWFDDSDGVHTVRASRLDAAGNYLDGAGVVLATIPTPAMYEERTISIDGNGPQWLVVWSANQKIQGRTVSRNGAPTGETLWIGPGYEAAVRWNGTHYVVLRSYRSLYSEILSSTGTVSETRLLAEWEEFSDGLGSGYTSYPEPLLTLLGGRMLAVYVKNRSVCYIGTPGACGDETTVLGRLLDDVDSSPFTIAESVWGRLAVAAAPTHALVMWAQYQGLGAAFLPAEAPEQVGTPFRIEGSMTDAAIAFDGNDFVAAWWQNGLVTARITPGGGIHDRREMLLGSTERGRSAAIAASVTQPALAGFIGQLSSYDNVPRAMLVFPSEIGGHHAAPSAPEITCATRLEDERIRVRWQPAADVLGIAIELQLPDGTFRTIGVAPSEATTAIVPLPGLDGSAVRIRTWNGFGVSLPSAIAPSLPAPAADVDAMPNACAGVPVEVTATLTGTPPFIVRWSDGVMQTVSDGYTATRLFTLEADTRIAVESVTDASCEAGMTNGGVDIHVTAAPRIDQQSRTVRVSPHQQATLSVVTATHGTRFAWYEGARGDTAHPVGSDAATFTTPPAARTMQYWVRLTTTCGTIDSETMTVTIDARRRAARK